MVIMYYHEMTTEGKETVAIGKTLCILVNRHVAFRFSNLNLLVEMVGCLACNNIL